MNILFVHRNFPAQFKHIVNELIKNSDNKVVFITNNSEDEIKGVKKIIYKVNPTAKANFADDYEEAVMHGKSVASVALKLRNEGFIPDIIYGHSWGGNMFLKDVFPDIPLTCYFEWFYNSKGADFGFFKSEHTIEEIEKLRLKNSSILTDLYSCDVGLSPTNWQKKQFPKEFHYKINVIHDGIDTEICKPDSNAEFLIEDKQLKFTQKDEVVTYATRGMEPYRGFPNFMKAVEILLKKRPDTHFVIAGEDEVFYGMKLTDSTYKELVLKEFDIDLSRVHFVGKLPYEKYIKLLQVSSLHVYLTCPFVLSWSMLEAMACGCCVIASNTEPVKEFIQDNFNGLLFDFFNIGQLTEKIEYSLDNKNKILQIKENSRKIIVEKYSLNTLLPKQIKFLNSFVK